MNLEPLRGLDDFLLSSARFQVPTADLDRWNKRVQENLIYYQTNYFLSATIIFLIVGVMHPQDMLIGIIAIVGAYLGCNYVLKNQGLVTDFKQKHPLITLVGVGVLGYMVVSLISSVLVFTFGILLPILVAFIHASLRLRDAKNKFSNFKDRLLLKKTPMGVLLEELGMSFEVSE